MSTLTLVVNKGPFTRDDKRQGFFFVVVAVAMSVHGTHSPATLLLHVAVTSSSVNDCTCYHAIQL